MEPHIETVCSIGYSGDPVIVKYPAGNIKYAVVGMEGHAHSSEQKLRGGDLNAMSYALNEGGLGELIERLMKEHEGTWEELRQLKQAQETPKNGTA